jgi:hypothetical protein
MIRPPQPTSNDFPKPHLELFAYPMGINLPFEGYPIINILVVHLIHLIQTHVNILTRYLALLPPRLH